MPTPVRRKQSQKDGKAPEGSEWDWTKAQLLPEGLSADGAALSQCGAEASRREHKHFSPHVPLFQKFRCATASQFRAPARWHPHRPSSIVNRKWAPLGAPGGVVLKRFDNGGEGW